MPKTHHLKTWPEHFQAVALGIKRAELRKDDRDYAAGDMLALQEWRPDVYQERFNYYTSLLSGSPNENREGWKNAHDQAEQDAYTGAEIRARVTHTLHGPGFGLEAGYVMMSLSVDEVQP